MTWLLVSTSPFDDSTIPVPAAVPRSRVVVMSTTVPSMSLRSITDDEVAAFWRDGVVCLRQIMPAEWLERMAEPLEDALVSAATTDLSAFGDDLAANAGAVRVVDDAVRTAKVPRGH